jgi:ATP-dependent Clp protease adaptor protein ClpS
MNSDRPPPADRRPAAQAPDAHPHAEPAPSTPPAAAPARTAAAQAAPTQRKELPPFRVLLHNDDVHDMVFVVESIVELTPLKADAAAKVMLEAHHRGIGQLLTTHRERAELYQDQFRSKGLVVTIEPA